MSELCEKLEGCGKDFLNRKCSTDGQFCVQTGRNSDDLVVTSGNVDRRLRRRDTHKGDADDWCKNKQGVAYWFEVGKIKSNLN